MKDKKAKPLYKRVISWIAWAILVQFILMNISAAFYAYSFTHLYPEEQRVKDISALIAKNVFAKTWRLFKGYRYYKTGVSDMPAFPYKTIVLHTKNGLAINTWLSTVDSAKGTVLLFHGLSGNKNELIHQAEFFHDQHYNVVLTDIRAHGQSEGTRTSIGFYESEEVNMLYDYVQKTGEKNIYLWGASMGAVMVMKAAAEYNLSPKGIICEMPFESLHDHIQSRLNIIGFPAEPFASFVTFWIGAEQGFWAFGFNSTKYAKKIKSPVLLMCGDKDELVEKEETNNIFTALGSADKHLVWYEGSGHHSLMNEDPALWKNEMNSFLTNTSK